MTEPGNINQLLPKGQDWIPRELADLKRQIRRLTGGTHAGGGGAAISAWGYYSLANTTAANAALAGGSGTYTVTFDTDDGSDPGIWDMVSFGIESLVTGTFTGFGYVRLTSCTAGDTFHVWLGNSSGTFEGHADVRANSSGVVECGLASAPVLGTTAPISPMFQLSILQTSGSGTAPHLQHAQMQVNKFAG